jgi:hypothetical protein
MAIGLTSIILACKAGSVYKKSNITPVLKTTAYEYNLHGPVKSIKEFTKSNTRELSKEKRAYYAAASFVEMFRGLSYSKFDENKMITIGQRLKGSFDSVYSDTIRLDRNKTKQYFYNKDDYKKKEGYISEVNSLSRYIYNPFQINLNIVYEQSYTLKVEKDSSDLWSGRGFDYIFDKSLKIIEEQQFFYWDKDRDGIIDKKKMDYLAHYTYDEKNQLIRKKYEIVSKTPISVTIGHNVRIPALNNIHPIEEYRYDEKGNLTAVYLYKTEEKKSLLFLEEYTYNEKNRLIKLKRIDRTDGTLINKHVRVINELFFNEQGEVSKVIAYNNDDKTVYATRLYTYEGYDDYGNWTICNKYLDGVITEVPTSITYRRFEYYNE